jgi:LPPG:FO 2-phospho-L-lactate transferase
VITCVAGGVGAARFLEGLMRAVPPSEVTAVVNTGDDTVLHGLHISPDLDTVTYTLAGAINRETGWGLTSETWEAMSALERYRGETWFRLGDRDLGTHLHRTHRLSQGATLTEVTAEITRAWGLEVTLLPMSDAPAPTRIRKADGSVIGFQEWFVGEAHATAVAAVDLDAARSVDPGPGVLASIGEAEVVVICPSNPVVSVGPVLAVPGIRAALESRRESVVAVSPIVGGRALKGPADQLMEQLGHGSSVAGVARLYAPFAATLVIDETDASLAAAVEAEGMKTLVTATVMADIEVATTLARTVIGAL